MVGFRGVKDAPKSVLIADAFSVGRLATIRLQKGRQKDCTSTAKKLHLDCTEAALMLHLCCTRAADQGAAGSMPTRHRRSGEKNDLAGVAHVAREFASIARNRSKTAFEREIGSPGSRRRDAKCSVHISASPEIALREIASSCSPPSSRSRESSSIESLRSRTSIACAIRLPRVKKRV